MRALPLAALLLVALPLTAEAQLLQLDVTYSNGQIIDGPLSADLTELPELVNASFLLNGSGAGFYATGDVLASSLVFGDGAWDATWLEEFAATLSPDGGALAVTALSYQYSPQDTPTTSGRIMRNFPLEIEGTDIASGQPFLYRYDQSMQTMTLVPEPSTCALVMIVLIALGIAARRGARTCFANSP